MGNHAIYSMLGAEARGAFNEGFRARGGLKYGDDRYYRELNNVQSNTYSMDSYTSDSKMASAFTNANHTFRDRDIVAATVRSVCAQSLSITNMDSFRASV